MIYNNLEIACILNLLKKNFLNMMLIYYIRKKHLNAKCLEWKVYIYNKTKYAEWY